MNELKLPAYIRLEGSSPYWCATHKRIATHVLIRDGMDATPCCEPGLGGIMIPCDYYFCAIEDMITKLVELRS